MADDWTRTTCPYCGVGCGVLVKPSQDGLSADVRGDPDHPANFGRLCSKGTALGETLSIGDRLLSPLIEGRRASWDEALATVSTRFAESIALHGPDSVAMYVSGQILSEDYYVANKLMKGFIGTGNIDTNSRLCMASSVAGHKRAFGSDTVPGTYEDLELADLVVLVGSNLAWCHPVLYQRLATAREERGTKVVVIDPRRTATCDIADLHLAIAPGTDVALFDALLVDLVDHDRIDATFVDDHTSGLEAALTAARATGLADALRLTGLAAADVGRLFELFRTTERTVTIYSQGVNQSSAGTDKVNAIINCHLVTGRIGKPGCGPFSVTGQPNAMGGRETGGLANMLAAHMEIADPVHRRIVQTFWNAPALAAQAGLKAVDLFEAVGEGRIKALWIMATSPVDSLPHADRVREAVATCPFVVVSDVTAETDTARLAHVLLPAAAWGEKSGTVTNSERRISRQRAFLPTPGEARPDWWQICEVAKRLGFAEAFDYAGPADIYREYAALTGCCNDGTRDLDISAHAHIDTVSYDAMAPFQWPLTAGASRRDTRFFADGGFFTPDRRGRFVATPFRAPKTAVSESSPFVLNTGRTRDQWHTMTRTGKSARLCSHHPEPFVEIAPDDAERIGVEEGDLAVVESDIGRFTGRVRLSDGQRPGSVFAPMHWTDQRASAGRINVTVPPHRDPVSGQPELKHAPVRIARFQVDWHGFAVLDHRPAADAFDYAAVAPAGAGWRLEAAGCRPPQDWDTFAAALLGGRAGNERLEMLAYHDTGGGQHRFAAFRGDSCAGLLYVARTPLRISRTWAIEQMGKDLAAPDRLRLLAGRPGATGIDRGPIVCACFEVGRREIETAISLGCRDVAGIGAATRAGTNCGSCRAEIAALVGAAAAAEITATSEAGQSAEAV